MSSINLVNYEFKSYSALEHAQKSSKLFELTKKSNLFNYSCSLETNKKLEDIIQHEVLVTSVGRKVIKELMTGQSIKISEWRENRFAHSSEDQEIFVNLNVVSYYMAQDKEGKFFVQGSVAVAFVHELFHELHHQQHSGYHDLPQDDLYPEMDNKEEQITICGLQNPSDASPVKLCENAFLAAQKKPYRINHRSILLPTNERLTNADYAYYGATKSIRKSLEKTQHLIDTPEIVHGSRAEFLQGKKLTPLSAAILAGQNDVVDILLAYGANPQTTDDIGGALFAALAVKRFDIFSELLNRMHEPIDQQQQNNQGRTLLEEFCLQSQNFSKDTEPFLLTNVALCFRKIMDSNVSALEQVLKYKGSGYLLKALSYSVDELPLDQDGNNLLMRAIKDGDIRFFVELLHVFSFDLEATNFQNDTPLKLALKHPNKGTSVIINYLKQKGAHIPLELDTGESMAEF